MSGERSPLAYLSLAVKQAGIEAADGLDPPATAALLGAIDDELAALRRLKAALEADLISQTKKGKFAMGEFLVVRDSTVKRSEWSHAGIVHELSGFHGGLVPATAILPLCSISYWRQGRFGEPGLRSDYGLDADQFCTVERVEKVTVQRIPQVGQ